MGIQAILGNEIINEIQEFYKKHGTEKLYTVDRYQKLIALSRKINERQFYHLVDKNNETLMELNLLLNQISIPPISNDLSDSKSGVLGMIKKRTMSLFYPHRNSDYSNFEQKKEKEKLNDVYVALIKRGIQSDELDELLLKYSSNINNLSYYKGCLLDLDETDRKFKKYKNENKH
jgi:hypothetical protein